MTAPDFGGHDRRSQMNYALAMTDSGRNPGEPDLLDEIRALTRDLSFEQRQARLFGELRAYSRPLSGRQRVEAALLEQQVATESRASWRRSRPARSTRSRTGRSQPNPSPGMPPSGHGSWSTPGGGPPGAAAYRTAGMNTITAWQRASVERRRRGPAGPGAAHGDPQVLTARYLAAVGAEAYSESAFGEAAGGTRRPGHLRFSPAEVRGRCGRPPQSKSDAGDPKQR